MNQSHVSHTRRFLFLQGPTNFLFSEIARQLRALGHSAYRINMCLGDQVFWLGPGASNFRDRPEKWPEYIEDYYNKHGITDLILLGEQRPRHREAICAAKRMHIEVIATDFGYLRPGWVTLEFDGLNGNSHFTRDSNQIMERGQHLPPIDRTVRYHDHRGNQALWDMVFHLSSALWPWGFPHFKRHTLHHPVITYLSTGSRLAKGWIKNGLSHSDRRQWPISGSYYLFAMQMEDDYSLRAYSHYPDLDMAMAEVITSFAMHASSDAKLLFKIHPLDPGLKNWDKRIRRMATRADVENRVLFVDGGDLDELIQLSVGVLTVNSTAGLRSIELLRPTLALGQAVYRVKGLVFDGHLNDFWRNATAPIPELTVAYMRLLAATLHGRGGMYDKSAIQLAANGMVYRLHNRLVNQPIPELLNGAVLSIPGVSK